MLLLKDFERETDGSGEMHAILECSRETVTCDVLPELLPQQPADRGPTHGCPEPRESGVTPPPLPIRLILVLRKFMKPFWLEFIADMAPLLPLEKVETLERLYGWSFSKPEAKSEKISLIKVYSPTKSLCVTLDRKCTSFKKVFFICLFFESLLNNHSPKYPSL